MIKQIDDITVNDLIKHPVWFFPGENEDYDELAIKPATKEEKDQDYSLIVRCQFTDNKKNEYIGYSYWQAPFSIEALQPVLIINDDIKIFFWQGMFSPEISYIYKLKSIISKEVFPIKYQTVSVLGLKVLSGELKGLYHYGNNKQILITKID